MKTAPTIHLSETERSGLEKLSRGRSVSVRLAERATMILHAASGMRNDQIGELMGVSRQKVGRWRARYARSGLAGIEKDAPRPGRFPKVSSARQAAIAKKTIEEKPPGATHWSQRSMARATGLSPATIARIWKAYGLKPHLIETFKLSNDKQFVEKLEAIVGLYLSPPEHAMVLSCDEKSQIQALDRTQPGLPMKKGRGATMTHDYKRNGTTSLFAAMNVADGRIIGTCMKRHRHQEWLRFLNRIKRSAPRDKEIHLICDNYATHKHPKVKAWFERNKRFHVHFTPTGASWLNMIERFFRDLSCNRLKRGVFRSVDELTAAIEEYIAIHNADPKPFIWTAKAHDILEKVKRGRAKLDKAHTA
jgi:transposase